MAKGASVRNVEFAKEVVSYRAPRDDEQSVMEHFAKHASKCEYCRDPYEAYKRDRPLCSRGMSYARDVANYLYAKGGKPFSVIDRRNGERVQVQVPAGCEAVSLLVKAFDKGMKTEARRVVVENSGRYETVERPIKAISPSPPSKKYYIDDRPVQRRYAQDDYDVVEIKPYSSRSEKKDRVIYREKAEGRTTYERRERPKSVIYADGKGSLFTRDEEERRKRERYERQPVIIVTEPGQRYAARR